MVNNYDPVARYYDFLSRLVFGQAEVNAQVELIKYINPGSRILIVGGGTGWILEELAALHQSDLHITYVERSLKMMALSKKRNFRQNVVRFVLLAAEQFYTEERYDCILTGFLFDNFSRQNAERVFHLLHPLLLSGGHWLYTDFYYPKGEGRLWQALLLRSMYISARMICGVEGRELVDMEPYFAAAGYSQLFTSFHYRRFIKSIVYQKNYDTCTSSPLNTKSKRRKFGVEF